LEEDNTSEEAVKFLDSFVVSSRFSVAGGLYSFNIGNEEESEIGTGRSLETTYKIARTYQQRGDIDKAIEVMLLAAKAGLPKAQYQLGRLYAYRGGHRNDSSNKVMALRWYREASKNGSNDAKIALAEMYLSGDGVLRNKWQAMQYLASAGKQDEADKLENVACSSNLYQKHGFCCCTFNLLAEFILGEVVCRNQPKSAHVNFLQCCLFSSCVCQLYAAYFICPFVEVAKFPVCATIEGTKELGCCCFHLVKQSCSGNHPVEFFDPTDTTLCCLFAARSILFKITPSNLNNPS